MNAESALYYPTSTIKAAYGKGIYLYDEGHREYIDCASATFNLSLGYSHPAVVRAIKQQAESLIHVTASLRTDPVSDLARKLVDQAPKGITKAHLKVCSGSTANEGVIKMAQAATGRPEVITLFRSHHGQTIAMSSMSGNAFRRAPFPIHSPSSLKVPDPYCYRCFYGQRPESCGMMCVERLDDFFEYASSGQVAAIMVEPISGNGGNIVPPEGYFPALRRFCDRYDILLILDEIQTGIGRTGRVFAAEHFGIQPDAITVAKGLGGSGAQVAAILTNDRLSGLPLNDHSFTYGSNVLAAAAGNVTMDIVSDPSFLANVRATGDLIMSRLRTLQHSYSFIGDVRGVGLMIGFEIVDDDGEPDVDLTNKLAKIAPDVGLILRTSRYGRGNVLKVRPPLILTMDQAVTICDRLEDLMGKV